MEKMMKENKVLILSLGKGRSFIIEESKKRNLSPEELAEILFLKRPEEKKIYQRTNYSITGSTYEEKSFVADPLIQEFDPDHVVVFGSATSAWSSFYMEYAADPKQDDLKELCRIEACCGIDTCGDELDRYEATINKIFRESGALKVYRNGKASVYDFKIILIRYGLNEAQLMENYERFQAVRECLYKEKPDDSGNAVPVKNIVSFDITFSFRSLPFYNLTVLNFLENISDYDIEIRNVYYGCIEAKGEFFDKNNKPVAPIVNLGQIIHILELTNGVSEFGNTGNAVTLISAAGERNRDFFNTLREFDWATQVNDFVGIEKALLKLSKWDRKSSVGRSTQPVGATKASAIASDSIEMVLSVIKTKLFGYPDADLASFSSLPLEERRYMIAMWYWKQNRYGQAIATALEALRSLLVPYDLEIRFHNKEKAASEAEQEDENNRKSAEQRLLRIGDGLIAREENNGKTDKEKKKRPEVEDVGVRPENYGTDSMEKSIIDLRRSYPKMKEIRNIFAHNLKKPNPIIHVGKTNTDDRDNDNHESSVSVDGVNACPETGLPQTGTEAIEFIDRFMECYKQFREKCWNDQKRFMAIYSDQSLLTPPKQASPDGKQSKRIGARLLIDLRKKAAKEGFVPEEPLLNKVRNGGNAYLMPAYISRLCKKTGGAIAVVKYLLEVIDKANCEIFLCTGTSKELRNIIPALLKNEFTKVKWIVPVDRRGEHIFIDVAFSKDFIQTPFFADVPEAGEDVEPLEYSDQELIIGLDLEKCRIK